MTCSTYASREPDPAVAVRLCPSERISRRYTRSITSCCNTRVAGRRIHAAGWRKRRDAEANARASARGTPAASHARYNLKPIRFKKRDAKKLALVGQDMLTAHKLMNDLPVTTSFCNERCINVFHKCRPHMCRLRWLELSDRQASLSDQGTSKSVAISKHHFLSSHWRTRRLHLCVLFKTLAYAWLQGNER